MVQTSLNQTITFILILSFNAPRKEKCLIKFKSFSGVQQTLSLMVKIRNIFLVDVGRYINSSSKQKEMFFNAKSIWDHAAQSIAAA
ncbi:IS6 family transposase (plasmid) [Candidatus Bandiella woodruffii]|uniref:IS6 family transposase n=1 Tax=Candidatus Bandiella euplotis TaxID=1664265 RepID=A0ABZ0UQN6_9RICK|nr:IS6 family transposase [Candidatus Bandiella woodruffii]